MFHLFVLCVFWYIFLWGCCLPRLVDFFRGQLPEKKIRRHFFFISCLFNAVHVWWCNPMEKEEEEAKYRAARAHLISITRSFFSLCTTSPRWKEEQGSIRTRYSQHLFFRAVCMTIFFGMFALLLLWHVPRVSTWRVRLALYIFPWSELTSPPLQQSLSLFCSALRDSNIAYISTLFHPILLDQQQYVVPVLHACGHTHNLYRNANWIIFVRAETKLTFYDY